MLSQKKNSLDRQLNSKFILELFIVSVLLPFVVKAQTVVGVGISDFNDAYEENEPFFDFSSDLLILEPVIQNYNLENFAYVSSKDDKFYVALSQMAQYVGLKYVRNGNNVTVYYANTDENKYNIDLASHIVYKNEEQDFVFRDYDVDIIDDTIFFSTEFWQKLLEAEIIVDELNMQLSINKETEFPTTAKLKAEQNRSKKGIYTFKNDNISNYDMDDRLISEPVVDITLNKGWGHNKDVHETYNNDSYAVNLAMLAGGLDVNTYFQGSSSNHHKPITRISGSRTFVNEPENKFNLKTLKVGDISGIGQSYFANASYGRGAAISSFKNLVMSANKTINLTGPLTEGWDVELYWNNQLIGFRQSGINGEYNFPDIPVSYGLNTFKLVFYGPYGETRTEIERYYSGTSPVKTGEFGYNFSSYQPYRYLIDNNRQYTYDGSHTPVVDMTGYYGATDRLTLMGGFTQTPDALDSFENLHFGMAGAQMALSGSSVQYNLEQNLDSKEFGHHMEWQGNISIGEKNIGNIYAGYDKYNSIHSPISLYGDEYLDEQIETRLSGILPYNVPYYLSYRTGLLETGKEPFENISARLSKQIMSGLNVTIEDLWYQYNDSRDSYNTVKTGMYKWWNNYTLQSYLTYRTNPDPEFTEIDTRLDYRTGRNTYVSGEWTRSLINDMDYFSISGGQIYPFGGLTATLETDRDFNLSAYLTYNVSFARRPDNTGIIVNSNSKLNNTGTMFVKVKDEQGLPIEGVGLNANSLEKEVYTDKNGVAVLADLQTYEKTMLTVDLESLIDISLQPENEYKKVILRPGTIRSVDIPFIHKGAVEGRIDNPNGTRLFGYQITAIDKDKKDIVTTFADMDGYFIIDGLPYGTYNIKISKEGETLTELTDVKVDDVVVYIEKDITVDFKSLDFFEKKDTEAQTTILNEEHEKGFNYEEYQNVIFPIDIEKDIFTLDEKQYIVSVSEIEEGIFDTVNDKQEKIEKEKIEIEERTKNKDDVSLIKNNLTNNDAI